MRRARRFEDACGKKGLSWVLAVLIAVLVFAVSLAPTAVSAAGSDDGSVDQADALVASVTVGGVTMQYDSIEAAWAVAKEADAATVTLLSDAEVAGSLTVEEGDAITFDGGGFELSAPHALELRGGVISVSGGVLTLAGGTVCNENYDSSEASAVRVTGGTFLMTGGTLTTRVTDSRYGLQTSALHVEGGSVVIEGGTVGSLETLDSVRQDGGEVRIENGTFEGQRSCLFLNGGSTVVEGGTFSAGSHTSSYVTGIVEVRKGAELTLAGGTFSSAGSAPVVNAEKDTLGSLLADGCTLKLGDAWATADELWVSKLNTLETMTVVSAPIELEISPESAAVTYGYEADNAPSLTVEPDTSTFSYQWYQDGEAIEGATANTCCVPQSLNAGEYEFTCIIMDLASGAVVSKTVAVTVEPKVITVYASVKDGYEGRLTKAYDGTTKVSGFMDKKYLRFTKDGVIEGDYVGISTTKVKLAYNSPNVDEANSITVTGLTLTGRSADNYVLESDTVIVEGASITKSNSASVSFKPSAEGSLDRAYNGSPLEITDEWKQQNLTVLGASRSDVTFEWKDSSGTVLLEAPSQAGTYTVTAVIKETSNTNEARSGELEVVISPQKIMGIAEGSVPSDASLTERAATAEEAAGQLPQTITVELEGGGTADLALTWACEDYDLTPGAKNAFTWSVAEAVTEGAYDRNGVELSGSVAVANPAGPTLYGCTLTLDGRIGVNFYVDMTSVPEDERAGYSMHFTVDGDEVLPPAGFDPDATNTFGGKTYYRFTCLVDSRQMADEVTAQLYDGEVPVSKTYSYSVRTYASRMMASDSGDESLVSLLKAMLNYGGRAQTFFDYKPDSLAYEGLLTPEEIESFESEGIPGDFATSPTGELPEGLSGEGLTLLLESEVSIHLYVSVGDGHDIGEYAFWVDGEKVMPTVCSASNNGDYYVEVKGIQANQLDDLHEFSIGLASDEEPSWSTRYGALTYAYHMEQSETSSDALKNLARALYRYNVAADAYAGWIN